MDDFSGITMDDALRTPLPPTTTVHLASPSLPLPPAGRSELTDLDDNGNIHIVHGKNDHSNNNNVTNSPVNDSGGPTGTSAELTHHSSSSSSSSSSPTSAGQQLDLKTEQAQQDAAVRWPPLSTILTAMSASPPPPPPPVGLPVPLQSLNSVPTRSIEAQQIREISYPKPESIDSAEDLEARQEALTYLERELAVQELHKRRSNSSDLMDLNDISDASVQEALSQEEQAFRDFEMTCSAKEIAKVLESFNAILENEDSDQFHELNLGQTEGENCMKIVDNFANLLIGGENDEEDLLIVVDSRDQSLLVPDSNISNNNNNNNNHHHHHHSNNDTDFDMSHQPSPDDDLLTHTALDDDNEEYPDDTEGYESDRPMVRASMRRLKPVQLLPMPSTSCCAISVMSSPNFTIIPESPCPSPGHSSESPVPGCSSANGGGCTSSSNSNSSNRNGNGLGPSAVVPGSPLSNNRILVTSLVRSNSSSSGSVSPSPELDGNAHRDLLTGHDGYLNCAVVNEVSNPIYGDVHSPVSRAASQTLSISPVLNVNTAAMLPASVSIEIPPDDPDTAIYNESPPGSNRTPTGHNSSSGGDNLGGNTSNSAATNSSGGSTNNNNDSNNSTPSRGNGGTTATTTTAAGTAATPNREQRLPPFRWPHRLSSVLALIGCTLGLNNICRFSLLSVEYGANFILQFLFLSLVFGIPLLTFHMSIGQYLSSGIVDMWKISPIFQGIGIGLVISQAVIGIYTAVGVSWIFIYFRDSFITRYDQYRWGKCFREYRDCNFSWANHTNYGETVPDYFNGVVLQRGSLDPAAPSLTSGLKFTVAFNLAVVWMLVFVSLSKGLKSYGKVIHGFILIPVAGLMVLASKVIGLVPADQADNLYTHTAWANFFFNSQTWVVAAREAFFTWGLLGACVMQITSHNRFGHSLKSDASIVVLVTTFVLLLAGFLGNACYSVISSNHYSYVPSSFESAKSAQFLVPTATVDTPVDTYMNNHISFLMGVRILTPEMAHGRKSGYQALRLATELFPTTMAILSPTGLSPFWTVLFYFTLILFGIAQQVAIWHCVIRGVIAVKSKVLRGWEITITFCVCATGFVLGLPLCTELGVFIEYFMDYVVGSGWWIMVLYLLELVAVFIVRGAPYCGENIVTVLLTGPGKFIAILAPLLSFVWNVILPVAMLVLSIASFKSGNTRELYDWNPSHGYEFWPSWTRELGSFMQLLPILAVPFVAIIQSCRYLSNGPPDLFERMQRLYRPSSRGVFGRPPSSQLSGNAAANEFSSPSNGAGRNEDPPPKYTPPPSYSTATGAKIAKFLRSSLRRSMRRFGAGPSTSGTSTADLPPPPNYASVILEINAQQQQSLCNSSAIPTNSAHAINTALTPILITPPMPDVVEAGITSKTPQLLSNTLERPVGESKERASLRRIASDITPRDIARLLRASFRRSASPERSSSASDQNNLNYSSSQQLPSRGGPAHSALNIEVDFLRIPPSTDLSENVTSENYVMEGDPRVSDSESRSGGRVGRTNFHIRSVSTGGAFMTPNAGGGDRGSTTDSQTTLVSHSNSQNDLGSLIDGPTIDFRLRGIVNPSFQFSHQSLKSGHDSLNQSDA